MHQTELVGRRLANQSLIGPPARGPVEVVRRLVAVQAQDYPGARWALCRRCQGVDAGNVDRLLADGRLLRTHVLRPTWHLVLPQDIRWLLRLTGARVLAGVAHRHRTLGLTPAFVRRGLAALARALRRDGPLDRAEIARVLAGSGIDARTERLGHLLMWAELEEVIVSGGLAGKQQTYALLDDRAPPLRRFDRESALGELALRYFASHGPAQDRDFAWWAWLTLGDARRAIAALGRKLSEAQLDSKTFWYVPAPPPRPPRPPFAHLLPNFDEYDVAYRDHQPNLDPVMAGRPRPLGALVPHIVTVNGLVIGGWRRTLGPDDVDIRLSLQREPPPAERAAIHREATSYAAHLDLSGVHISYD